MHPQTSEILPEMINISESLSTHNLELTYIYRVYESRFSTYLRLRRVLGWINRFIHDCLCLKTSSSFRTEYPTVDELNDATVTLVRIADLLSIRKKRSPFGRFQSLPHLLD